MSQKRDEAAFRALSDATRRQILRKLKRGSKTAGELAADFDMTKGSLSYHFNILKAADLVRCERQGQNLIYSLNTTVLEDIMSTLMDLFETRKR